MRPKITKHFFISGIIHSSKYEYQLVFCFDAGYAFVNIVSYLG